MNPIVKILYLPTILFAIIFGLIFYVFHLLTDICGWIFFGWLKLTTPKTTQEMIEKMRVQNSERE